VTTEPWATAYHEAGHAVAARALGLVVTRVTIEPRYDTFYRKWRIGTTEIAVIGNHATDYSGEMRDRLRREAIFSLAGNAVERRAFDRPLLEEDHTDSDVAEWLLSRDTPQRDLPRVLRCARAIADWLVRERWSEIESLAAALMRHGSLSGQQPQVAGVSVAQVKNVGCRAVSRPEVPMRLGEPSP